ncbi:hypothetical protein IOCL2690_000599500 [Leishmania lindenbergi]|uniref:Uncharacterized protein n=1 Tax=Leishmania lindenbergi TaxID=651832 RepID=A0AAW3A2V7_9TRYP
MRCQQSFTVQAVTGAPATAALPIDAECFDAPCQFRSGVDVSTYRYLDELWIAALRRAEASVLALPHTSSSGVQRTKYAAEADSAGREEAAVSHVVSKRRVSSTCNDSDLTSSPLPRAPAPPSSSAAHPPAPQLPPPPAVVARRPTPFATDTQARLRVEAQPNLKRNMYTAQRGVAWVVR